MPRPKPTREAHGRRRSQTQLGSFSGAVRHVPPDPDLINRQASQTSEPEEEADMPNRARNRSRGSGSGRSRSPSRTRPLVGRRSQSRSGSRDRDRDRSRSRSRSGSRDSWDNVGTRHVRVRHHRSASDADAYSSDAGDFDPPDLEIDDQLIFDTLDLPKSSLSNSLDDSSRDDNDNEDESGTPDLPEHQKGDKNPNVQLLRVFSTKYKGGAEITGAHGAILGSIHDPKGQRRPLFKWLHIRQDVMDYEDFWLTLSRNVRLSEKQAKSIATLKSKVKPNVSPITNSKGSRVSHMEPRYIEVAAKYSTANSRVQELEPKASWICLPFFSLRPYSGLLAASDVSMFPNQTLLQMLYRSSPRERDMEQAVCKLGTTPRGECFHVEQLWCLVLGDDLLVTCGSMDRSVLESDVIQIGTEPSRQSTQGETPGTICVQYDNSTVWLVSANECPTWFSFQLHFHELWPEGVTIYHGRHVVDAKNWPDILDLAKRRSCVIKLEMIPRVTTRRRIPPIIRSNSMPGNDQGDNAEFFHTLAPVCDDSKASASNPLLDDVKSQLEAADKFLRNTMSSSLRLAYKNGKASTRRAVQASLMERLEQEQEKPEARGQRRLHRTVSFFNDADDFFQFFFPASFEGPTTDKFWGAIESMLQPGQRSRNKDEWERTMTLVLSDVRMFQSIFSYANEEERARIKPQTDLTRAWLYGLSATIDLAATGDDRKSYMSECQRHLKFYMKMIMDRLGGTTSLCDRAMMLPTEVVSLISLRLLKDQVGKSDDIVETYTQYLNSLNMDIATEPSGKPYQQLLSLVQQELTAIRKVLGKQRQVIEGFRSKWPGGYMVNSIPEANPFNRMNQGSNPFSPPPIPEETFERITRRNRGDGPHNAQSFDPATMGRSYNAAQPGYRPSSYHMPRSGNTAYQAHYPAYPVALPGNTAYSSYPAARERSGWRPYDESMRPFVAEVEPYHGDRAYAVRSLGQNLDSATKLSPTEKGGFRALFLGECARTIGQRELDVQECAEFAVALERSVVFTTSWVRDRQEQAIFAFTVVTIIFLPLSSVASIFGMNTSDVRDMGLGQWAYWAVAIPVTVVVIVGVLWWMNELGGAVSWVRTGKRAAQSSDGVVSVQALGGGNDVPAYDADYPPPPPPPPPPPRYESYGPGAAEPSRFEPGQGRAYLAPYPDMQGPAPLRRRMTRGDYLRM